MKIALALTAFCIATVAYAGQSPQEAATQFQQDIAHPDAAAENAREFMIRVEDFRNLARGGRINISSLPFPDAARLLSGCDMGETTLAGSANWFVTTWTCGAGDLANDQVMLLVQVNDSAVSRAIVQIGPPPIVEVPVRNAN